MAEEINPLTGLPYVQPKTDVNPLTGKPYMVTADPTPSAFTGARTMTGSFDDYKGTYFSPETKVDPFTNIDEVRAQNQSNWDKWGNGLVKGGATFVGAVSENTLGYALGLADYALSGFEDFEESMTNNVVGQAFDEINEYARENLPNYQTAEERREQGTLASLGNANFWADTFLNGAAYSLGSIASAYLTGGVGVLGGIGRAVGAGAKISKGLAGYRAAKAIQNGVKPIEALKQGAKLRATARAGSKALGYLEGGAMMSIAESAVEARETERRVKDELIGDYMMRNGVSDPNMIPEEDMQDIEDSARLLSNQVFDANMAVLMPTNLIQFHGMLRPMQLGSNAIHGTRFMKEGGKKVLRDQLDGLPGWAAKGAKLARTYGKPLVGSAVTEGFQEGTQFALSEGAVDVAKEAAEESGNGSLSIYEALTEGRKNKVSMLNLAEKGAPKLKSAEGREQVMVGALVGLISGGMSGIRSNVAKDQRTKEALEHFANLDNALNLRSAGAASEDAQKIMLRMERAEAAGNIKAYEDAQFQLIRTLAFEHAERGTFDAFIERLEDAKDLSAAEFESLFGQDTYSSNFRDKGKFTSREQQQNDRIDSIIERAQELKEMYEQVEEMFPTVSPKGALLKGFTRLAGGKQKLAELKQQDSDAALYKKYMVLSSTQYKNGEARLEAALRRQQELDPEFNAEEFMKLSREAFGRVDFTEDPESSEEQIRFNPESKMAEALRESRKRVKENNPTKDVESLGNTADIFTLAEQKNTALLAYKNLERSPEQRDLFVSRAKAEQRRQEQLAIDQQANDAIEQTDRADVLERRLASLPTEGENKISEAARKRVVAELQAREDKRDEFITKYQRMEPSEVLAIDPATIEDPLEREAFEMDLNDVKAGRRKKPIGKAPSKKAKTDTTKASTQRPKRGEAENTQTGGARSRGSVKKAADQQAEKDLQNSLEIVTQATDPITERTSGQFMLATNGRTQVDENGEPLAGFFDDSHTRDGVPIIDGRDLLVDPEVTTGTKARIVGIENDWWKKEATPAQKEDEVSNYPLYVEINGKIVGILPAGNTPIRNAYFASQAAGESLEVTVAKKHASNIFTAEVAGPLGSTTGRRHYYNPAEALDNPIMGIVTVGPDGPIYTVPQGDLSNEVYAEIQESLLERPEGNVLPGRVFFMMPNPNGGYTPVMGETAVLTEADQAEALSAMEKGDTEAMNLLQGLVGTNVMHGIEDLPVRGSTKILLSRQAGDVVLHTFNAVNEDGSLDTNVSEDGKLLVRVSNKTLARILAGEKLRDIDLSEVERKSLLVQPKVNVTESGAELVDEIPVADDYFDRRQYVLDNLEKLVRNILANKRYQVARESLNTEGNFLDPKGQVVSAENGVGGHMRYLTRSNPDIQRQGHNGIIASGARLVNGSVFTDIGLALSGEFKVSGEVQAEVDNAIPHPKPSENSQTTAAPDPTPGDLTSELGVGDLGFDPNSIPGNSAQVEQTVDDILEGAEEMSEDELRALGLIPGDESETDNDAPFRLRPQAKETLDEAEAKAWLEERGIPVEFYAQARVIGNGVVHGYMENAGVYLWTQGEVGTEYHEGFHYVFRTLLNDKQRNALYKEAAKRYNLTQEELDSLKGLNPQLALQQLRELGLEERMAEDFRDYVMTQEETSKTLPGKIRKFFRDLYNFIKALFIDPVSMRQLYSLIESNRLPKSYLRNTQKFTTRASAYAYVEAVQDRATHKELALTLSTRFVEAYNAKRGQLGRELTKAEFTKILGEKDNKGTLADAILRDAFSYRDGRNKLSTEDFAKIKNATQEGTLPQALSELGVIPMPPVDTGLPDGVLKADNNQQHFVAKTFIGIYQNWEDQVSKEGLDNIEAYGFRSVMIQDLERFGFSIKYRSYDVSDDQKSRDDQNDEISQFDKVYALSSIEQNPLDSLSGETKRQLSTIKSYQPNFLGLTTYIDVDHIVRLIVPAAAENTRLDDIVQALGQKSIEFPELIPVVDALNNEFTAQQRALFKRTFANTYNRLRILEESFDDDNNKSSRIINSNRKSAAQAASQEWKANGIEKVIPKDNAPLVTTEEGALAVNPNFGPNIEEGLAGQDRLELLVGAYTRMRDRTLPVAQRVDALSDTLFYMGVNMGTDRARSRIRWKKYLNQFDNPDLAFKRLVAGEDRLRIEEMVKSLVDLKVDKNGVPMGQYTLREKPVDFFRKESSTIEALSKIKAVFEVPVALSIVNGAGKAVYPYNLQTPFSDMISQLQKEEIGEDADNILKLMAKDEFFNTFGIGEHQSILMRLGESNKFALEVFSLDVFKVEDDETSSTEYEDASARESLLIRLDAYANNGNANLAVYAVPTQEGRGRMDFLTMPRFGNAKAMKVAGLQDMGGHRQALKGLIIQDLIRIQRDNEIIEQGEDLIKGYHTGGMRYKVMQLSGVTDKMVRGRKLSERVNSKVLENPNSPQGKAFHNAVNEMVDVYLKTEVEKRVSDLKDKISDYNLNVEGKSRLSMENINKLGGLDEFLKNYVIDDIIARLEMAKIFRGGIQTAKDTTDFYKRMGLINTPGNIFMMRGEDLNDPEYGMKRTYRQIAMEDYKIVDEYHTQIVENYKEILKASGTDAAAAERIAEAYGIGMAEATDAQAFISPDFWRSIKQGEGTWTDEMEQKWKKWKDTGKWTFGFVEPLKMYHEEQRAVPFTNKDGETIYKYVVDMDKNSYHVLTPDVVGKKATGGKPDTFMRQMYDKMISDNIDIFNTVSAKKGVKQNIFKVDPTREKNLFEGATVTEQRGKNLRKPQTINDKEYDLVRLSRQLRKNAINLVERDKDYTLNAGIAGLEETITGQEMLDRYHDSFETMMRLQMEQLKEELGYADLINAQEKGDATAIKEARETIFKKLRDMFLKENLKRDRLDANTERQLQLVYEDGAIDFAIPLGMPAYQDKYQNLFFSMFKNRVLKTMMMGKEVVQVASPGEFDVFNFETGEYERRELRYLDAEIREDGSRFIHAEVLISAPIAKRLGLKPGDSLSDVPAELLRAIGYRIPHQGKSSTLMMKVAGILPKSYNKSIVVPGNITVMMGSDFDVDKMFVMFPEFAKASELSGDVAKVSLNNYESLRPESGQNLLMAAHKNNMLDVIEAVAASEYHAEETLTPLATDELERIIELLPEKDVDSLPFDHPLKEIQMEENYKFAQRLVGVYATMLAGLSVAANGNRGRGVAVHPAREVVIDNENYSILSGSKESFGILIEHLSGALDAGKKVIQPALNDNLETAAAKTFMYALGVSPELVTKMHRAPIIMEFAELVKTQGLSPSAAFKELGLSRADQKLMKALSMEGAATFIPTTSAEVDEVLTMQKDENGNYPGEAVKALRNFAVTYYGGKDMETFFKAIVTDVADGIGDLGTLQVILESIESFDREKGMFGGADVAQFLQGDSFGISRAFFTAFSEMMALTSDFFLGATPAVKRAKDNMMQLVGRDQALTEEEHRMVDRQLFYWMMTQPGSPLNRMVRGRNAGGSAAFMVNSTTNMVTQLATMRKAFPEEVGNNKFVMRLKEAQSNESEMNRVYNIQFENMDKMTTELKDELIAAFEDLLFNKNPKIKTFGQMLVMNQLITNGFSPGYGSYFNLIPTRFFTTKVDPNDNQTPAQFARAEIRKVQQDGNYFNGAMFEIIQNIGARRTKGRLFVPETTQTAMSQQTTEGLLVSFQEDGPVVTLRKNPEKKKVDKYQLLLRRAPGQYMVLNQKSLTGQLNEINSGAPSVLAADPGAASTREGLQPEQIMHVHGGTAQMISDTFANNAIDSNLRTISSNQNDKRVVSKRCE